jgi:hypothetical protein
MHYNIINVIFLYLVEFSYIFFPLEATDALNIINFTFYLLEFSYILGYISH